MKSKPSLRKRESYLVFIYKTCEERSVVHSSPSKQDAPYQLDADLRGVSRQNNVKKQKCTQIMITLHKNMPTEED